ncbi:response regulator transcription factor [Leucobacter sp. UT-8R-CII-1-4]|uniref:response regulator n=1 Tax=Leucobacter sp. UT-8R-CII-1-4 TaxID=3040075 RepID=UPI0024A86E55|nr:response regulator transcription factor [Leucobacter sp. UT-8R-CII-1-4]MDI6024046.1 response regulator transcription factor [Leucobacter sp. UT-8R-CII-1-4]
MIRVVIVDDEALVRSGFRLILGAADDIEVAAAVDGPEAIDVIQREEPDVVLLDIRMPGRSGLDVLADIREMPTPPVVAILTTFDSDDYIAQALSAGAAGFLVKDTDPEQLPTLIRSLAAGGIVLSPQVSKTVINSFLGITTGNASTASGSSNATSKSSEHNNSYNKAKSLIARLTERERQVLALLATGLSNAEIGLKLHLSVGTIKDHVSALLAKLEVTTRLQAALIAERAGLTASADHSA